MRIAIFTSGRFHVCDLARELYRHGHDVAFYSLVPAWRTRAVGLPDDCNRWLGPYVAPFYALVKWARTPAQQQRAWTLLNAMLDRVMARVIDRCDVFIGMSGLSTLAGQAARRRFGARVLIERGSRHILSQREILEELPRPPGAPPPISPTSIGRELSDYQLADTVVVPSRHVVESFVERGFPEERLFRNPYGVDLGMFPPTPSPSGSPTIVTSGLWSYRKGVDVLVEAWRRLSRERRVRLLHVGDVSDAPLPRESGFEHHDKIDQLRLSALYAQGHVFALGSREEGLALVQAQALASGLPLVCTDRTGGADLRELCADPSLIEVVPHDDPWALAAALARSLERAQRATGLRDPFGAARDRLSWRAYGERYHRYLTGAPAAPG